MLCCNHEMDIRNAKQQGVGGGNQVSFVAVLLFNKTQPLGQIHISNTTLAIQKKPKTFLQDICSYHAAMCVLGWGVGAANQAANNRRPNPNLGIDLLQNKQPIVVSDFRGFSEIYMARYSS